MRAGRPRPARGRRGAAADAAVHADAVHGRGVGRDDAVALLHLLPRRGARRGCHARAGAGVRAHGWGAPTCPTRRRRRRSGVEARLGAGHADPADRVVPRPLRPPAQRADLGPGWAAHGATTAAGIRCSWGGDAARPDWFAVARGPWRTVVNLSSTEQLVPVEATRVPWPGVMTYAWPTASSRYRPVAAPSSVPDAPPHTHTPHLPAPPPPPPPC